MNIKQTFRRLALAVSSHWLNVAAFLGTLVVLSALPLQAFATAPDFGFTPPCTDRSISDYLVPIFGGLGDLLTSCGGTAMKPFERAMGLLNGAVMTVGGILAAYTLVAGTMQTAHDGEMLGKKWSSMWLPIRTVLGVGLIVPIAGGYCVAQIVMMFLITQGIGIADIVWKGYLENFATPAGLAPTDRTPAVNDLAKGILNSQMCMAAYNAGVASGGMAALGSAPMAAKSVSTSLRSYGIDGGFECGSVRYSITNWSAWNTSMPLPPSGQKPIITLSSDQAAATDVEQAHLDSLVILESDMKAIADGVIAFRDAGGSAPNAAGDFNAAILKYQANVTSKARGAFASADAMNDFVTAAKVDGWYLAGAWFMKASDLQDKVNQAVSKVPSTSSPDSKFLSAYQTAMGPYFTQVSGLITNGSQASTVLAKTTNAAANSSSNPLTTSLESSVGWLAESIFNFFKANPNRSALMAIKDIGDYVMTGGEVGMLAGITLVGASNGAQAVNSSLLGQAAGVLSLGFSSAAGGASAGVLSAAGYILIMVSALFFGLGSMIAIYLPFAPFLIYFGAFIGWLILCGEAIIAAPLWAIMHLAPSGDDVMGGARQGYMLILGILLRPVLILFGFLFALTAVYKNYQGFNGIFFPSFKLAMTGSVMGVGTIFVMLCIYFATMVWIFHTVFGLVHLIPDKLLQWIGGGHSQLGETAQGISRAGKEGASDAARHSDMIRGQAMTSMQQGRQLDQSRSLQKSGDDNAAAAESRTASKDYSAAQTSATVAQAKAEAAGAKMHDKAASVGAQNEAVSSGLNDMATSRKDEARSNGGKPDHSPEATARAATSMQRIMAGLASSDQQVGNVREAQQASLSEAQNTDPSDLGASNIADKQAQSGMKTLAGSLESTAQTKMQAAEQFESFAQTAKPGSQLETDYKTNAEALRKEATADQREAGQKSYEATVNPRSLGAAVSIAGSGAVAKAAKAPPEKQDPEI